MNLRAAAPLLALALLMLAVAAPGASAAPAATATTATAAKTVVFNMYPSPLIQPKRVFFQANSGPFLDALAWSGWGSPTATAAGTWTLDCSNGGSSCAPGDPDLETHPARYVLRGLAPCPRFGATARSYRTGTVEIDLPTGPKTIDLPSDYDFCAKPVTARQARAAVARYVRRHRHVAKVVVGACARSGSIDRECRARWTEDGRKRTRAFDVSARMSGPLLVFPLGD